MRAGSKTLLGATCRCAAATISSIGVGSRRGLLRNSFKKCRRRRQDAAARADRADGKEDRMKRIRRIARRAFHGLYDRLIPRYRTRIVNDLLPKQLGRRTLYIVQEDGFIEQAAMICPGGCGRVLQMNLLPDERPCWRLTRHKDGTATLYPSVWRKKASISRITLDDHVAVLRTGQCRGTRTTAPAERAIYLLRLAVRSTTGGQARAGQLLPL